MQQSPKLESLSLLIMLLFSNLQTHLPGFIDQSNEIRAKGISEIVCVSVNDPFVMAAWGDQNNAAGKVTWIVGPQYSKKKNQEPIRYKVLIQNSRSGAWLTQTQSLRKLSMLHWIWPDPLEGSVVNVLQCWSMMGQWRQWKLNLMVRQRLIF